MIERFFAFLEHMRAQPEHTRRTFALSVAAGVTLLLLVVWGVFVLPRSISNAQKSGTATLPDVPTPDQTTTETGDTGKDWATSWNEMQAKYGNSANTNTANTNTNVSGSATENTATQNDAAGANTVTPKNYNPDLPVLPETPSYPSY